MYCDWSLVGVEVCDREFTIRMLMTDLFRRPTCSLEVVCEFGVAFVGRSRSVRGVARGGLLELQVTGTRSRASLPITRAVGLSVPWLIGWCEEVIGGCDEKTAISREGRK